MARVEFPAPLRKLLEGGDLQAPIRALADRAGEILADNKLPFFPNYTDHGTDHINAVLKSEVDLIPKPIWEDSKNESDPRLLCDADAAVIIGATLLHDIAMHVRPDGFQELVSKNSRFQPLPWFRESHEGHAAEVPWQELWDEFVREARRFSDRDLTNIIGEDSARTWKFNGLSPDTGEWETNHNLVVGEFIRRHHARLAHEIAIYGFPGLPTGSGEGQFPAMGTEEGHVLMQLADLIGLTARSHGMSLRVCKSYLESGSLYPGTPRPMGTAVFYPMALLRVADYLQIDKQRAPAVLLRLRNPQSPISVQEWKKHRAVQSITASTNPRGKMITVSTNVSLSLYLQLRDLLIDLQAELDHATAILDEEYGTFTELGLNRLNLAIRRIYSNLQSPPYRGSLPYVPSETGFTSDPNLLTLLVQPLYGNHPGVGVRELLQNAVDAVYELHAWCKTRGKSIELLDLPKQAGDVLVEFTKQENGRWLLRVRDVGIGMTADTIQHYFLRAGASFRRSSEWTKEFVDDQGRPNVMRSGRFGIGVFAVFLLGPRFRMQTRHASSDKSTGYSIEASFNSQLIEISRVGDLQIGTTIEVELSDESVGTLMLETKEYNTNRGPQKQIDWFCWDWPKVVNQIVRDGKVHVLPQEFASPISDGDPPPEWSVFHPPGFDAVYWTFRGAPGLSCNGLRLADATLEMEDVDFSWPIETQLRRPCVAVLDKAANLPVTIQRYELSQDTLPFTAELTRDVLLSFVAHALVCGPQSREEALRSPPTHPLSYRWNTGRSRLFSQGMLRWCSTREHMVPVDPWLFSLLQVQSYVVCGAFAPVFDNLQKPMLGFASCLSETDYAILPWYGIVPDSNGQNTDWPLGILAELVGHGVEALGFGIEKSGTLVSVSTDYDLDDVETDRADFAIQSANKSKRRWITSTRGAAAPSISTRVVMETVEGLLLRRSEQWREVALYMAEIERRQTTYTVTSLVANIWNECLGTQPIPFDSKARQSLIAVGSKHTELRRHIQAWQAMSRSDSQWVKIRR